MTKFTKTVLFLLSILSFVFFSCNNDSDDSPSHKEKTVYYTLTVENYSYVVNAEGNGEWQSRTFEEEYIDYQGDIDDPDEKEYTIDGYTYYYNDGETYQLVHNALPLEKDTTIIAVWDKYIKYNNLLFAPDDTSKTKLIKCAPSFTGECTIPNTVTTIENGAFKNSKITSVTLPSSITSIGAYAFYDCEALTSVTFNNVTNCTVIPNRAFALCKALATITLPDCITEIGEHAFDQCVALTSFTIPENCTKLDSGAFEYCTKITSIDIPQTVTFVGGNCFIGWTASQTITLKDRNGVTINGESSTPPLNNWMTGNKWWYSGCKAKIYAGTDTTNDLNPNN